VQGLKTRCELSGTRAGHAGPFSCSRIALAAPVDGKSNDGWVALVADKSGYPKPAVTIMSGASARMKPVRIETK